MKACKRKELGQHIVADPEVCGGQLTFKGTRIFVKDVLAMLAKGYDWDRISSEFDGRLSHEAIAETIASASDTLKRPRSGGQRSRTPTNVPMASSLWSQT